MPWDYALSCCLLFLASFISFAIYGATAFGYAIVYHAIFQLLVAFNVLQNGNISDAVQEIYVCAVVACSCQIFWYRRHMNGRFLLLCTTIPMLAQPFGLRLLFFLEDEYVIVLKRMLGGIFITVAVLQYGIDAAQAQCRRKVARADVQRFDTLSRCARCALLVALLANGFLAGLFNTGGPPLMIYLFLRPMDMPEWQANLGVTYIVLPLQGLYLMSAQGLAVPLSWDKLIALACGSLCGVAAGNLLAPHVSLLHLRQALLWMLVVGAFSLLSNGDAQLALTMALLGIALAVVALGLAIVGLVQKRAAAPKKIQEPLLGESAVERMLGM